MGDKYEECGDCKVDWEEEEEEDGSVAIGGAKELNKLEGRIHAKMKKRMSVYKETGEFPEDEE